MSLYHFFTGSALFSLIGGLITLVTAIIVSRKDDLPLYYQILLFIAAILTLGGSWWGAAEQLYFQEYVTGGDSYVYLTFEDEKDGYYCWHINHKGEFPVYDVDITIRNLNKFRDIDSRKIYDGILATRNMDTINVVRKESHRRIQNLYKLEDSPCVFVIWINSRNRNLEQVVSLQKVGEEWKCAYLVSPSIKDCEPIDMYVDDEYPRNEDGKVDWFFEMDGKAFITD